MVTWYVAGVEAVRAVPQWVCLAPPPPPLLHRSGEGTHAHHTLGVRLEHKVLLDLGRLRGANTVNWWWDCQMEKCTVRNSEYVCMSIPGSHSGQNVDDLNVEQASLTAHHPHLGVQLLQPRHLDPSPLTVVGGAHQRGGQLNARVVHTAQRHTLNLQGERGRGMLNTLMQWQAHPVSFHPLQSDLPRPQGEVSARHQ